MRGFPFEFKRREHKREEAPYLKFCPDLVMSVVMKRKIIMKFYVVAITVWIGKDSEDV